MNELDFCPEPLTQHQHKDVQEKLEAIVRCLARCEAQKDYHHQQYREKQPQQDTQRKDH